MQNAIPRAVIIVNIISLVQKQVYQTNGKITCSANKMKRSIVGAIGVALLQKGHYFFLGQQKLLLAGCFSAKGENNEWLL